MIGWSDMLNRLGMMQQQPTFDPSNPGALAPGGVGLGARPGSVAPPSPSSLVLQPTAMGAFAPADAATAQGPAMPQQSQPGMPGGQSMWGQGAQWGSGAGGFGGSQTAMGNGASGFGAMSGWGRR